MNSQQTLTQTLDLELSPDPLEDYVRLPGLLRRWELQQVVQPGAEYRIEEAGELEDGTSVFAVYHRTHARPAADAGVWVTVTFEADQLPLRARLMPISSGEPLMAVLIVGEQPGDGHALTRVRDYLARAVSPETAGPLPGRGALLACAPATVHP